VYLAFLLIALVIVAILYAATGATLRAREANAERHAHCCGCPAHQKGA
jgi:hypothetical protein